jgi:hypothetical protein
MWCEPAGQECFSFILAFIAIVFFHAWLSRSRKALILGVSLSIALLLFLFWWVVPLLYDLNRFKNYTG